MRGIKKGMDSQVKEANPNLVEIAAKAVFRVPDAPNVADPLPQVRDHAGAEGARRAA